MHRLNHPEYDSKIAERNAHSAELLDRLDDELAAWLGSSLSGRLLTRRFRNLCARLQ